MYVYPMIYGLDSSGKKIIATPKGRAVCPVCKNDLIAKCGLRIVRHWAHRTRSLCDPWSEETPWHISWKSIVREERCEVVIKHSNIMHRADILGNKNIIIELQHSPISPQDILDREKFYKNMIWLFDAGKFAGNIIFKFKEDYAEYTWYYPRTSMVFSKKPVYFHLPCGNIFKPEDIYLKSGIARGWGRFIGWKPFFYRYLSTVVKPEFSNALQPWPICNRRDLDNDKLKFHQNSRNPYICECDCTGEYPGCRFVKDRARQDFIMRILAK